MSSLLGLVCAVMACMCSNGAIQMIDQSNTQGAWLCVFMTLMFAGFAYIGLTSNERKEDNK